MANEIQGIEAKIQESQAACDRTLDEIASIKEQLGRAKGNARATGQYSDSDWYHAANRALRHKQAEHQRLLRETAELRRQLKVTPRPANDPEARSFERAFMIEAKAFLPGETYRTIIDRTLTNAGRCETHVKPEVAAKPHMGAAT